MNQNQKSFIQHRYLHTLIERQNLYHPLQNYREAWYENNGPNKLIQDWFDYVWWYLNGGQQYGLRLLVVAEHGGQLLQQLLQHRSAVLGAHQESFQQGHEHVPYITH
jgi:hypothetical protein